MRRLAGRRERPSLPSASLCGGGEEGFGVPGGVTAAPAPGEQGTSLTTGRKTIVVILLLPASVGSVSGRVGRARRVR